jgi:Flp pilus assembly pilin Flp
LPESFSDLGPEQTKILKESNDMTKIKNFLTDESGIETMEYAIIAAIVAAVAVLIYGSGWGQAVKNKLTGAANVSTNAAL